MKYIKTYEESFNIPYFIIVEEYGDLYLDKVIYIDEKNDKMKTETLRYYNSSTDKYSHPNAIFQSHELHISGVEELTIYKTYILEEAKREMRKIVSLKRKANKYNL